MCLFVFLYGLKLNIDCSFTGGLSFALVSQVFVFRVEPLEKLELAYSSNKNNKIGSLAAVVGLIIFSICSNKLKSRETFALPKKPVNMQSNIAMYGCM